MDILSKLPIVQIVIGGKILIVGIMILYTIFAYILIKRVKLMNLNLTTKYTKLFEKIALLHFILSILVVILSVLNL